jgi:hypothetical protein
LNGAWIETKMPNEFLPYGAELNELNGICDFNLSYDEW